MTIICPQKSAHIKYFLFALFTILLMGGGLYIVGNSSLVEQKHELEALKRDLITLKTANADLKNEYFRLIDPATLEAAATGSGLTLEKRPQYLTSKQ